MFVSVSVSEAQPEPEEPLDHEIVQITSDAVTFLQGQLSQDVDALAQLERPPQATRGGDADVGGRALAEDRGAAGGVGSLACDGEPQ